MTNPIDILHKLIASTWVSDMWRRPKYAKPGALVGRCDQETRKILSELKSSDIAEGKVTREMIIYSMNEEYWRWQEESKMMMEFDKKLS